MWTLWTYSAIGFAVAAGLSWLLFDHGPDHDDTNRHP